VKKRKRICSLLKNVSGFITSGSGNYGLHQAVVDHLKQRL